MTAAVAYLIAATIILGILGAILVLLVLELIRLSKQGQVPAFESSWGGLGGGVGGWSVNRMMTVSILALVVLLIFASIGYTVANGPASFAAPEPATKAAVNNPADKQNGNTQKTEQAPAAANSAPENTPSENTTPGKKAAEASRTSPNVSKAAPASSAAPKQ